MGNGRGGTNHGAERPKGVGNKRRPARLRAERAGRRLRFDYMLEPLNDKTQPIERRDRMVIADAPLDPRLNTIATAKTRFKMTTMEIDHLLARELKHAFNRTIPGVFAKSARAPTGIAGAGCESPPPQHRRFEFGALAVNCPIPDCRPSHLVGPTSEALQSW